MVLNMKKYKIQNTFVPKSQQTMKGFTLIELLMVVALIAILSTMILISLDSGREKAEVNRYVSYATQMYRLVADSAAAGQFDSGKITIVSGSSAVAYCLGGPDYECGKANLSDSGTGEAANIYKALTYLTKMPKTDADNSQSPYAKGNGVYMLYKPVAAPSAIRIVMAVGTTDATFVGTLCKKMNWKKSTTGNDCYIDVKLHSRL